MSRRRIGDIGEEAVEKRLQRLGCKILARNYRSRFGEIDIIASDGSYVIFVEVKARGIRSKSSPREAVGKSKQERIRVTAEQYLSENPTGLQPRFDVAEVYLGSGDNPEVIDVFYIENAFW